ncbi:transposase [bacterium]|nr:transposase [bacterium]
MIGTKKSNRSLLFRDDEDRIHFLNRLNLSVQNFGVRVYLYCLMGNHFHLLIETPRGNLSQFMHSLNTAYTIHYNLRHRRHGHLMDGRYKAQLVSGDKYLLKLSRYIHLNPVNISTWKKRPIKERVTQLRAFRWSSYRGYIGKRKQDPFVDMIPVLKMVSIFGKGETHGYREYVEYGLANSDAELEEVLKQPFKGIGGEDFRVEIERIRSRTIKKTRIKEDVSFRRVSKTMSSNVVLKTVAEFYGIKVGELKQQQRASILRPAAARMLIKFSGKTQREVAEILKLGTGSAVSAQIKKLNTLVIKKRKIKNEILKLEEEIQQGSEKP